MNILDLMEKDHEKIKMLLEQIQENLNNKSKRNELLSQIKQELLTHNKTEESLVYKELEKRGNMILAIKSQEEHKLAEKYLETIKEDLHEAPFLARVEVLKNIISSHIDEEEDDTFEKLKEEFSEEDLNNLGQKFQDEKDRLNKEK